MDTGHDEEKIVGNEIEIEEIEAEEPVRHDDEPEWLDDEEIEDEIAPEFDEDFDPEGSELASIVASGMREGTVPQEPDQESDRETLPQTVDSQEPAPQEPVSEVQLEEAEWVDDGVTAEEPAQPEKKHRHRGLIITLIVIAAAILAFYLGVSHYFTEHYLPGTVINGIDCTYMTVEEVEDEIQSTINEYSLELAERGGSTETLYGADFDIHVVFDGTLDKILEDQGPYKWPAVYLKKDVSFRHEIEKVVAWDEGKFEAALDALDCMDEAKMIDPKDAEIVYSDTAEEYYVERAVYGTHIQEDVFDEAIANAVTTLSGFLDIEEAGVYETPNVTEESQEMVDTCEEMNRILSTDITYDMIDIENIHIPKETISSWILLSDDLEISYDVDAMYEYVANFAENYNTVDSTHTLVTTWGPTVTITNGSYGWRLDQDGEVEQLIADLDAGETVVRQPVWGRKAVSHGANDYGNTYVEINLTAQYLYYYRDGELIVESSFVSGRMTEDRMTHEGIYYVYYMQSPAVLKGDDYETPVTYWMPFNGGEGMHDATWRSSFGGTIYINNGSHGCINLPYSVAQTIYQNISVGTCVIVYWLDGTSGSAENGVITSE